MRSSSRTSQPRRRLRPPPIHPRAPMANSRDRDTPEPLADSSPYRLDPDRHHSPHKCDSWPRYLTTAAAALYCGFKTTGALRKAAREGRITPAGRRGGSGTWMWAIKELDRFLRGEAPRADAAKVSAPERSGAPPSGGSHGKAERGEVVQGFLDFNRAGSAPRLAEKGGRTPRAPPGGHQDHRRPRGALER